jgi:nucleoside-diphosphate-sugar epimerase
MRSILKENAMNIAVTGATGFLGRYIVQHLAQSGHACRCWFRPDSDRGGFDGRNDRIEWIPGDLTDTDSMAELLRGTDAVIHCALWRPGSGFIGAEGDVATFVERNVLASVRLIESARKSGVARFVFISTCAVHDVILDDRKLDEAHPTWAKSHYGAHKAAIEQFVYSFGLGHGYNICALRPTGIYGIARPTEESKWFNLVQAVKRGEKIASARGGKEVHAADVAKATGVLLQAEGVAGQVYNCYDMYIAEQDVAEIAKRITGSRSDIEKLNRGPKNQIETSKLRALGMEFGGRARLEETIAALAKI